ncbi:shikimate kinase [Holdemania filiformis]|uniref:Shikimate kinase n=1 Tax=Holdemania filiformis DSM 12042 TaxID=545696 RepID=B9Y6K8_9FIRM|nr:shikimate kinase [Holdemania filiformis]EEF68431.1 shikimate kinase [Holdemania filiformis DSM 12042]
MRRGLIGEHLGHSYSQRIHETLGGYPYELIEVALQDLDAWMKNKDFAALNVTIPYKKAVIPYLEELDERARRIGAVNTIVNDHGRLIGKNTDYYGCRFMLEQAGMEIQGRKVILLGNGGAAQAVQAVLEDLGAAAIVKVKRNPSPETLTYEEAYRDHSGAQVIVNTSPVGMFPAQEGIPVELDRFPQLESVADVIYNPHRTRLIVEAQKRGCRTATGLSMLTAQAAEAIEAFIGKPVAPESILRMTAELAREKMNLVLIGMPGCGKSTIARKLAEISGRPAVDIDQRIVERIGMPIRDFFAQQGEARFRQIEAEILAEVTLQTGQIIATGGGIVKDWENVRRLRQSGKVYFLDRSLDQLETDPSRPLSSSREARGSSMTSGLIYTGLPATNRLKTTAAPIRPPAGYGRTG